MSLFTGAAILAGALAAGTGAVVASKIASGAAKDAAGLQTDAAKYGADAQTKATQAAETFSRQQAETDYQNQELARRANYDQTAAKNARLGTLGNMLGLPPPSMPDYVASVDPRYTSGGAAPTGGATGPAGAPGPTSMPGGSDVMTQLAANYKALGVAPTGRGTGPTDIAYFADQIKTPADLAYFVGPNGRIAQELAKAKGGASANPTAATTTPTGTLGTLLQPYRVANPTAALTTPGGY